MSTIVQVFEDALAQVLDSPINSLTSNVAQLAMSIGHLDTSALIFNTRITELATDVASLSYVPAYVPLSIPVGLGDRGERSFLEPFSIAYLTLVSPTTQTLGIRFQGTNGNSPAPTWTTLETPQSRL